MVIVVESTAVESKSVQEDSVTYSVVCSKDSNVTTWVVVLVEEAGIVYSVIVSVLNGVRYYSNNDTTSSRGFTLAEA